MKFLLFGTGDYYNRYKKWFEQQEIVALLDNSVQKQYTIIDGIEVLPPEEGIRLKYDSIVILSFYVKTMKEQLMSLSVDETCIYHFYDLHYLLSGHVEKRLVYYFLNAGDIVESVDTDRRKVVLLSNDLAFGGPAIALFHAAKILKNQGYMVVYASMMDGPLKSTLIDNDIPVIVDENLQISTMQETDWVSTFSLIICNTLNYYVFLSERDTVIPVIWWLHDARFFYDGVDREVIGKISSDNLKIISVGPVPAEAVGGFLPDMSCEELLYGVDDVKSNRILDREPRVIKFVAIGFLEDIKGQDVLLHAVRMLSDDIRIRCRFYIVGHNKTLFGERICAESKAIGEVILTGSLEHTAIHSLLEEADVLVCPSRQDSMPTVAAEAMMHFVPCIVSDATGTAAYINDGENGFVFPCEDVQALADRINWCVVNKEQLGRMGKKARELYEEHFSMPVFKKRFMEIIHEMLEDDVREPERDLAYCSGGEMLR